MEKRPKGASEYGRVAREATHHRTDQASLKTRMLRMFFPLLALFGLVMMSFTTLFVLLNSVSLDESRMAPCSRFQQRTTDDCRSGRDLQRRTHEGNR